ncbi:MAG: ribosome recycling factor [Acidobacteriota bacterium]
MLDEVVSDASSRMDGTIEAMRKELATIRTGRASVTLLDGIEVEAYGSGMPLNQVATLAVPEPSMITVKPFDISLLGDIEKAILKADLGINPNNDGKLIRLPVPPLTEERRKQLARKVSEIAEKGKTAVRNVRRDANEMIKQMEKDGDAGQDDARRSLDQVQKATDDHVSTLDKMASAKEAELMEE